jgi:hypothetical protein
MASTADLSGSRPSRNFRSLEFFVSRAVSSRTYDEALGHVADAFLYYSQFPQLRERRLLKLAQSPAPPLPSVPSSPPNSVDQPNSASSPGSSSDLSPATGPTSPPASPSAPRPLPDLPYPKDYTDLDKQQLAAIREASRDKMLNYLLYGSLAGAGLGTLFSLASRSKKRPFRISDVLAGALLGGTLGGATRAGMNYFGAGQVLPGYQMPWDREGLPKREDLPALYEYVTGQKPPVPPSSPPSTPSDKIPSAPPATPGTTPTGPGPTEQPSLGLGESSLRLPEQQQHQVASSYATLMSDQFPGEFFPTDTAEQTLRGMFTDPLGTAQQIVRRSNVGARFSFQPTGENYPVDLRAAAFAAAYREGYDKFALFNRTLGRLNQQIAEVQEKLKNATTEEHREYYRKWLKNLNLVKEYIDSSTNSLLNYRYKRVIQGSIGTPARYFESLHDPFRDDRPSDETTDWVSRQAGNVYGILTAKERLRRAFIGKPLTYYDLARDYAFSVVTKNGVIYTPDGMLYASDIPGKDLKERIGNIEKAIRESIEYYILSLSYEFNVDYQDLSAEYKNNPASFIQKYAKKSVFGDRIAEEYEALRLLEKYVLPVVNPDEWKERYSRTHQGTQPNNLQNLADQAKDQALRVAFHSQNIDDYTQIVSDYVQGKFPSDPEERLKQKLLAERALLVFRKASKHEALSVVPGTASFVGAVRDVLDTVSIGDDTSVLRSALWQSLIFAGPVELAVGTTAYPAVRRMIFRRAMREIPNWIEAIETNKKDVVDRLPKSFVAYIKNLKSAANNNDLHARFMLSMLRSGSPDLENVFGNWYNAAYHARYLKGRWWDRAFVQSAKEVADAGRHAGARVQPHSNIHAHSYTLKLNADLLRDALDQYVTDYKLDRQQAFDHLRRLGLADQNGRLLPENLNAFIAEHIDVDEGRALPVIAVKDRTLQVELDMLHSLERNLNNELNKLRAQAANVQAGKRSKGKPKAPSQNVSARIQEIEKNLLPRVRASYSRLLIQNALTDPQAFAAFSKTLGEASEDLHKFKVLVQDISKVQGNLNGFQRDLAQSQAELQRIEQILQQHQGQQSPTASIYLLRQEKDKYLAEIKLLEDSIQSAQDTLDQINKEMTAIQKKVHKNLKNLRPYFYHIFPDNALFTSASGQSQDFEKFVEYFLDSYNATRSDIAYRAIMRGEYEASQLPIKRQGVLVQQPTDQEIRDFLRNPKNTTHVLEQVFGQNGSQKVDQHLARTVLFGLSEPESRLMVSFDMPSRKYPGVIASYRHHLFSPTSTTGTTAGTVAQPYQRFTLADFLKDRLNFTIPTVLDTDPLTEFRSVRGNLLGFVTHQNPRLDNMIRSLGYQTVYDALGEALRNRGVDISKVVAFDPQSNTISFTDDFLRHSSQFLAQQAAAGKSTTMHDALLDFLSKYPTGRTAPGAKLTDLAKVFEDAVQETVNKLSPIAMLLEGYRVGLPAPFIQESIHAYKAVGPHRRLARFGHTVTSPKFTLPMVFGLTIGASVRHRWATQNIEKVWKDIQNNPLIAGYGNLSASDLEKAYQIIQSNPFAYAVFSISGDQEGVNVAQGMHNSWSSKYNIAKATQQALQKKQQGVSQRQYEDHVRVLQQEVLADFDMIIQTLSKLQNSTDHETVRRARTIERRLQSFRDRVRNMTADEFMTEFEKYLTASQLASQQRK